jgi:transposase
LGTKRKNRSWSFDEKRSICHQASVAGVSVAQVARRYAMNANLIHKWLRDRRYMPPTLDVVAAIDDEGFLPVEIEAVAAVPARLDRPVVTPGTTLTASRVDITLSDGRRVLIEGPTGLCAALNLVQGLAV